MNYKKNGGDFKGRLRNVGVSLELPNHSDKNQEWCDYNSKQSAGL